LLFHAGRTPGETRYRTRDGNCSFFQRTSRLIANRGGDDDGQHRLDRPGGGAAGMCGRQHGTALAGARPTLEATEQFQPGRFGDALVTQVDGDEAPGYGNGLRVERCPVYTAVQTP